MESHGNPGTIQVTRSVIRATEGQLSVPRTWPRKVKGKGLIETWLLDDAPSAASGPASTISIAKTSSHG